MNGLLELSFEGIPQEHLTSMALNLIGGATNVNGGTCQGDNISLSSIVNPQFWTGLISVGEEVSCHVNLHTLKIQGTSVAQASLLFVRYNNTNDISVLLSTTDCRSANLLASDVFYQWARKIAEQYGCADFCGGLDSASDEDTQLYARAGVSTITSL